MTSSPFVLFRLSVTSRCHVFGNHAAAAVCAPLSARYLCGGSSASGKISPRSAWAGATAAWFASKSGAPPHSLIRMPSLSPTMEQGNIVKWRKAVGDRLTPGDVLVEIETDKAQMDFEYNEDEAFIAALFLNEGARDVKVGTPLALLALKAEDVSELSSRATEFKESPTLSPSSSPPTPSVAVPAEAAASAQTPDSTTVREPVKIQMVTPKQQQQHETSSHARPSPVALLYASKKYIPLDSVQGTGPGGRIILADIKNYQAQNPTAKKAAASTATTAAANVGGFTTVALTNMRRVIAARLSESKATIPHYYLTSEITMDRVIKLREVLKAKNRGTQLSYNDFVVRAAALALQRVPQVNAAWAEDGSSIRLFRDSDICVAVATEGGLLTPIVRAAQNAGLGEISRRVKDFATRAKQGELQPHEFQGGSFTISNLGMYGSVQHFTAIINPPQAAILAVGGIEEKIVRGSVPGEYEATQTMRVTLSCDHRVVDGAVGAEWLREFKQIMEEPLNMLL